MGAVVKPQKRYLDGRFYRLIAYGYEENELPLKKEILFGFTDIETLNMLMGLRKDTDSRDMLFSVSPDGYVLTEDYTWLLTLASK